MLCCVQAGRSSRHAAPALASRFHANVRSQLKEEGKMPRNHSKWLIIVSLLFCVFFTTPVYAHKVNIFAYAEGGKIYTESYFPDGKAVEEGTIEVLDSQNQKIAEFKTDKEGKSSFPIPKKDDLTIVINASMGHRNSFLLKKTELGE
jgi:nickel transport protein